MIVVVSNTPIRLHKEGYFLAGTDRVRRNHLLCNRSRCGERFCASSSSMIAIGDGMRVESREPGGLLPSCCVESPTIANMCPSALSPAATVCTDGEGVINAAPEFKLSQCFGDCSPAEEATPGEHGALMGFSLCKCKGEPVHLCRYGGLSRTLKVTLGSVCIKVKMSGFPHIPPPLCLQLLSGHFVGG